jgi:hypothetical protein
MDHERKQVKGKRLMFILNTTNCLRIHNPGEMAAETKIPPTARPLAAFYLTELAVPLGYIFVISHALTNVASAPSGGARRSISITPLCLPCLGPSDCAPRTSLRGTTAFHLDLLYPQRLAHDALLNRPGADDDANDDIDHTMGPRGLDISPGSVREAT